MAIAISSIVVTAAAILLAPFIPRWIRAHRRHDPVEYYRSWGGYRLPIVPVHRITREAAEAQAAAGYAYYVCHFDAGGKLTRVIKMLCGEAAFDLVYAYHPNGKLKTSIETSGSGEVKVQEFDERGRVKPARRN